MTTLSGPHGVVANDAKTGAKGEPMTPIPSATLVILCPISNTLQNSGGSGTATAEKTRYATLMVQRSARAGGSFRSAVVFPGGLLDQADDYAVARSSSSSPSSSSSSSSSSSPSSSLLSSTPELYLEALRLCALRETFEETGLLLLPATGEAGKTFSRAVGPNEVGMTNDEWSAARKSVHDDARLFPALLRRILAANASATSYSPLQLAPLRHHSNWVTPHTLVRPAKRFDTHFFLTVLDTSDALGQLTSSLADKQASAVGTMAAGLTADGTETTNLRLSTPDELLLLAERDEIILFPPQYYILSDVYTSLTIGKHSQTGGPQFAPLYFNGIGEQQERFVQDDGLQHRSAAIQPPPRLTKVSSVEPQGMSSEGEMIPRSHLQGTGGRYGGGADESNEDDEIFVMPLVLPGDVLRPVRGQQGQAKRNRVYVTPRSKGEGGGLMVHGAERFAQPGLLDFRYGYTPAAQGDHEEKMDRGAGAKL